MNTRNKLQHLIAAVLVGVLVGGALMATTPAGAQVAQVATNWKKIWKKQLAPHADKRYYKKADADAKYQPKGSYEPAGSGYSKAESDARYAGAGSSYSKAESDSKYAAAGSTYSKADIDAKLAPLVNSVAATAGGDQTLALTPADQVVRSVSLMPPSDGTVIVSSSGYLQASAAGIFRCSITTGVELDFDALQSTSPEAAQYHSVSGTRGFAVTKGNLLTVNLVCDEFSGEATLRDSALTAIFAPS